MPKKTDLGRISRAARRSRARRSHQTAEEIVARNAAGRIKASERRKQESREQRDERLQQGAKRMRALRKQNITLYRERARKRQQIKRALRRATEPQQHMVGSTSIDIKEEPTQDLNSEADLNFLSSHFEDEVTLVKEKYEILNIENGETENTTEELECTICRRIFESEQIFKAHIKMHFTN